MSAVPIPVLDHSHDLWDLLDSLNARGAPVLEVRFFDAEGQPFPRSLWRLRADGSWLECIRP